MLDILAETIKLRRYRIFEWYNAGDLENPPHPRAYKCVFVENNYAYEGWAINLVDTIDALLDFVSKYNGRIQYGVRNTIPYICTTQYGTFGYR